VTRHDRAIALAREIEHFDLCPILTNDSIIAIDRALAQYALERLIAVRSQLVALTLSAPQKTLALETIDALIREDHLA
jgi:hypothetical protein